MDIGYTASLSSNGFGSVFDIFQVIKSIMNLYCLPAKICGFDQVILRDQQNTTRVSNTFVQSSGSESFLVPWFSYHLPRETKTKKFSNYNCTV